MLTCYVVTIALRPPAPERFRHYDHHLLPASERSSDLKRYHQYSAPTAANVYEYIHRAQDAVATRRQAVPRPLPAPSTRAPWGSRAARSLHPLTPRTRPGWTGDSRGSSAARAALRAPTSSGSSAPQNPRSPAPVGQSQCPSTALCRGSREPQIHIPAASCPMHSTPLAQDLRTHHTCAAGRAQSLHACLPASLPPPSA